MGPSSNYEDQVEREENCLNLLRFIVAIQRANSLGGFGKKPSKKPGNIACSPQILCSLVWPPGIRAVSKLEVSDSSLLFFCGSSPL